MAIFIIITHLSLRFNMSIAMMQIIVPFGDSKTTYSYNVTPGSVTYGMMTQQTDSSGATTRYFYNDKNGRLASVPARLFGLAIFAM